MPTTALSSEDVGEGITILELLVKCGLVPSKGEGRRLVQQGGILAGDEKVASIDRVFSLDELKQGDLILRKGKKTFHRVVVK